MYNIKNNKNRGCHAHRKLMQMLICVNGSCSVLLDDGKLKENIILSDPAMGLFVMPKIWHEISNCSKDTVILSLASDYYDEKDYIRNYDDFKKYLESME
jgi:dTDP-4-dehydrorhamnose 3,5-epimerase-like enzyme